MDETKQFIQTLNLIAYLNLLTHSKNIWLDRRSCWMADTMAEGRRDNLPSG